MEDDKLETVDTEKSEESTGESVGVEAEGTEVKEKVEDVSLSVVEKTPIADDMRTKLNIPPKFKYWEDVAKWGSEAEKAKSRAEAAKAQSETEKIRYERELTEREEIIADMEKDLQSKAAGGSMSSEEREEINRKFQEDLSKDYVGTMDKLFMAFEKKLEEKQRAAGESQKWKKEESELKVAYPDDWDSVIKPALVRIAAERPYLQTIKEVLAIYEQNKAESEKLNKAEVEAKKTEKKSAFVESGSGTGAATGDIYAKIAEAKTEEELEKLTAKFPRKERL